MATQEAVLVKHLSQARQSSINCVFRVQILVFMHYNHTNVNDAYINNKVTDKVFWGSETHAVSQVSKSSIFCGTALFKFFKIRVLHYYYYNFLNILLKELYSSTYWRTKYYIITIWEHVFNMLRNSTLQHIE